MHVHVVHGRVVGVSAGGRRAGLPLAEAAPGGGTAAIRRDIRPRAADHAPLGRIVAQDGSGAAHLAQLPQAVAQRDDRQQQTPTSAAMNNMDVLIGGAY